jgi:hypothetical protein
MTLPIPPDKPSKSKDFWFPWFCLGGTRALAESGLATGRLAKVRVAASGDFWRSDK